MKLELKARKAGIGVLKRDAAPVSKGKWKSEKMHVMTLRRDLEEVIDDYEVMYKHLKKMGVKIKHVITDERKELADEAKRVNKMSYEEIVPEFLRKQHGETKPKVKPEMKSKKRKKRVRLKQKEKDDARSKDGTS